MRFWNVPDFGALRAERVCASPFGLMLKYGRVVLCYIEGDDPARKLYEKLGFRHTGEADGNEIIMEKLLR